jgi:hypothetical protein
MDAPSEEQSDAPRKMPHIEGETTSSPRTRAGWPGGAPLLRGDLVRYIVYIDQDDTARTATWPSRESRNAKNNVNGNPLRKNLLRMRTSSSIRTSSASLFRFLQAVYDGKSEITDDADLSRLPLKGINT